jgi:hypothetical protein
MKQWTPQHQALLDALRSAHILPRLIRRLSQERYAADDDDLRRMSEWPATLMRDPGWAAIGPMLDSPRAWPQAWERAVALGFSPTSDHHHALYLCRLTDRALADEETELAQWAWAQGFAAWRRVLSTDYMINLIHDIVDPDPTQDIERRTIITQLLDHLIDQRAAELADGLGLRRALVDGAPSSVLRRHARFAMVALDAARVPSAADPTGALTRAAGRAGDHVEALQREAADRFAAMLKELDPASAPVDELLRPFLWVDEIAQVLGADDSLATPIIEATVELGWTLRKVKRAAEQDLLSRILDAIAPLQSALEARLLARQSLGHNSKCSDIFVFMGEQASGDGRRAAFARALAVCPGHRNAAMLMSYEELAAADKLLTLSKEGGLTRGGTSSQQYVRQAHDKVSAAAKIYPHNKELGAYKTRLSEAAARVQITLEDIPTGAPDA